MKKLLYLFILATTLSCSDSSESEPIIAVDENFIGTWNLTKFEAKTTSTTVFEGIKYTADTDITGKDYDFTFTFSQDPNEYVTEGQFTQVIDYKDNFGQSFTQEYETGAADGLTSGTWEIRDNQIFLNGQGIDADAMDIVELDDNLIVLESKITQSFTEDGYDFDVKADIEIVFER